MSAPDREFALQWLQQAHHDLFTAKCVLDTDGGPTDTPAFHAQQAVEKAFKGLLTAGNVHFERTHDLMPLLDAAARILPELDRFRPICAQLSEYGVGVRYPGILDELSRVEVESAVATATEILNLIERYVKDRD